MNFNIRPGLMAGCVCAMVALFSPTLRAQNVLSAAPEVGVDHPELITDGAGDTNATGNARATGNAQGAGKTQGGQGNQHAGKMQSLAKALGLTEQQKNFLRPVMQQCHFQVMAVRDNHFLSPRQKGERIKQIRRYAFEEMKSVLTVSQQRMLKVLMARVKVQQHGQQRL